MNKGEIDRAMIHGRFQPFHKGHLAYLAAALSLTRDTVLVGITNPFHTMAAIESSDVQRHIPSANPFSFVERAEMIQETVRLDLRPPRQKIIIVPLPIHNPELWPDVVSPGTVQIVNIIEEWDKVKAERFRTAGYSVRTLALPRLTSGSQVRECLRNRTDVSTLVPRGTLAVLSKPISIIQP